MKALIRKRVVPATSARSLRATSSPLPTRSRRFGGITEVRINAASDHPRTRRIRTARGRCGSRVTLLTTPCKGEYERSRLRIKYLTCLRGRPLIGGVVCDRARMKRSSYLPHERLSQALEEAFARKESQNVRVVNRIVSRVRVWLIGHGDVRVDADELSRRRVVVAVDYGSHRAVPRTPRSRRR
jgi:hypothetical protein